jgi:6-hydroxy-3-succinoylpyridine 3-monooxygenase
MTTSLPTKPVGKRVIFYIDGFNLYYGALKDVPPLKWLNLEKFCTLLRPHDEIVKIRYFSALVAGHTKPHQEIYLKALSTTPIVSIILGKFKAKKARCGVLSCSHSGGKWFKVPEEKRTDVNIAIYLLDDAYQDQCDHFIVFSGDSDLVPAVSMVRQRFPTKRITVYVPFRDPERGAAVELRTSAHAHRDLPLFLLAKAQFPDEIQDGAGNTLKRPDDWK